MQAYFGIWILASFIGLVLVRSRALKKQGIEAIEFGRKDKKDFLLVPFALFYLYSLLAHAFHLPAIETQPLFRSAVISWIGVCTCLIALLFFLWTMISFRTSFRVGLVENTAQGLITTGAFARSRNPIYLSFAALLIGQFLIFPSWTLLLYVVMGTLRFHRQVLKEEAFLQAQYGEAFTTYRRQVRRYL